MYAIYALIDPRDETVHYIGITKDVYERFLQHLRGHGGNWGKNDWIEECRSQNIMITMRTLEVISSLQVVKERERFWIEYYLSRNMPLSNRMSVSSARKNIVKKRDEDLLKKQYTSAEEAWEAGVRSIRKLAKVLGTSYANASRIRRRLAGEPDYVERFGLDPVKVQLLWNSGCNSNRKLMKALRISYFQADELRRDLLARGIAS